MSSIYVTGKASSPKTEYWQGEINYSTWFNNDGTSTVRFSSIRIKKGSTTTEASTPGTTKFYLIVNGTSYNIGALGISVPKGGTWSAYGYFTLDFTVSAGNSLSVGLDDPWNALYVYNNDTDTAYSAALPTYPITYNANGGSGTVSGQTKTWGTTLFLRNGGYTRSGYNLLGWSTNSSASSPTWYVGDDAQGLKYTTNAQATMYAIWEPAEPQFNVTTSATETSITYAQFTLTPASDVSCTVKLNGTTIATKSLGTNVTTVAAGSITNANCSSGNSFQPGQTYTVTFTALNHVKTTLVTTKSYSQATYEYPHIVSFSAATNGINAGSTKNLTIYNPLGRNFIIHAKVNGDEIGTTTDTTGAKGNALAKSIVLKVNETCTALAANEKQGSVYYSVECTNFNPSITINNTGTDTIKLTQDNAAPTINTSLVNQFITYSDIAINEISGDASKLFNNKSKVRVSLDGTKIPFVYKGTSLKSYTLNLNTRTLSNIVTGTNYYETSSGISTTASSAITAQGTTYTIKVTATDQRDFTATVQRTITIYPYTSPVASITRVYRDDGYGTDVTLEPSITWCANMTNIAKNTVNLYYKKTTDPSYPSDQPIEATITNGKISISSIDSSSAYNFYFVATDNLNGTGTSATVTLSVGVPPVFVDVEQHAIGVDCLPAGQGIYISGNRVVAITSGTSAPSASAGSIGDIYIQIS